MNIVVAERRRLVEISLNICTYIATGRHVDLPPSVMHMMHTPTKAVEGMHRYQSYFSNYKHMHNFLLK